MSAHLGLISDTHGLLRPEALVALEGSDLILHAGDVGDPGILDRLGEVAPVFAVRGNTDSGALADALPVGEAVESGGARVWMQHILDDLGMDPRAAGFRAVVYGHTHLPQIEWRKGVLYVNPGSAGPPRFDYPVTVGRLEIDKGKVRVEVVEIVAR